jgi:hypothetical protein
MFGSQHSEPEIGEPGSRDSELGDSPRTAAAIDQPSKVKDREAEVLSDDGSVVACFFGYQ